MFTKQILTKFSQHHTLLTISYKVPHNASISRYSCANAHKTCAWNFYVKHEPEKKLLFSQSFTTSRMSKRQLSETEHVNNDLGKLLYVGREKGRLKIALGTFYALGAATAAAAPFLMSYVSTSVIGTIGLSLQIFTLVVLNPILLYQFGRRHVNELRYDKNTDTYTALLLSPLIYKDTRLTFTAKDCKMPANPSVFTSFYVKKRALFVNSHEMEYDDYMKMLRHASDFDYENPDRQEQYSESIQAAVEQKQGEQHEEIADSKEKNIHK